MHICLDLLAEQGYIEQKETLKETYESVIGIYNLEREDLNMWKMVWNHEIQSLFQMEKQSGIQGIALTHPQSVDDLAVLNSVIRLMAQEKGAEQPLNKFARFKEDIGQWYSEMKRYGLTEEEMTVLEPVVKISYGICESQEKFMQLVQMPECGGFNLTWADKLRKSIAKKNPAAYEELQEEYFKTVVEKGLSKNLCNYVWNVLVATSRGYGFNASHTLAYSLIALQEMNLAFKYPIMFWNCACLISDSGGAEEEENDEEIISENDWGESVYISMEDFTDESSEEADDEDDMEDDDTSAQTKTKKKTKTTNYGRIAAAIGKIKATGVTITPPDINYSTYTFSPDVDHNTIRYGLSGITRVGDELVKEIIANRPYNGIEDFLSKVKVNKTQMLSLIKCGAFDGFGEREKLMKDYVLLISDAKKRITLQNMKMLIDFNLIPEEYDLQKRVYNFNRYLKKFKYEKSYLMDNIAFAFYEKNFDLDILEPHGEAESGFAIDQSTWDKIYKKHMDIIRPYVQKHNVELLEAVNNRLIKETWDKYCLGSLSKWEMDSVSCYFHEHELINMNNRLYGFSDFKLLPEEPQIDTYFYNKKDNKKVPLFKIKRIAGTVLDRDKAKKTVTLLTTSGVVTVKIFGAVFAIYDKQISEKGADGKKHVIEKSMFTRGNKVIITGIRRDDSFIAKKYSRTPYHLVEQIVDVREDGSIITHSRNE